MGIWYKKSKYSKFNIIFDSINSIRFYNDIVVCVGSGFMLTFTRKFFNKLKANKYEKVWGIIW